MALQGAGLALPTLWLVLPFALGAYLAGGVGHGTKNVLVRTLIHARVPDELRGRAWAAYSAGRNGAELIALVGGGLLVAGHRRALDPAARRRPADAGCRGRAGACSGRPAASPAAGEPHVGGVAVDDHAVAAGALGLVQGGVGGRKSAS